MILKSKLSFWEVADNKVDIFSQEKMLNISWFNSDDRCRKGNIGSSFLNSYHSCRRPYWTRTTGISTCFLKYMGKDLLCSLCSSPEKYCPLLKLENMLQFCHKADKDGLY